MRARRGLEGHLVHANERAEPLFGANEHFDCTLRRFCGLQRVDAGKTLQRGNLLVDGGVVFHGAGAERIEPVVDAVDLLLQLGIMAADVNFAQFRQAKRRFSKQRLVQFGGGYLSFRNRNASSTGDAAFK
ncbi:hypothetical protein SDC9_190780 [bioreactor metagenome]|uniref:Uncharacterized protein n=1 Tax=bioreactor metagenome TaxID=1076179 RepID=A0A645HVY6_9ZZZZ